MEAITQRIARMVMSDNGTVEGTMKVVYVGQEAIAHRQSAVRTDAEGRKKELKTRSNNGWPSGAEVKLVQEPVWEANAKDFSATFHIQTAIANNAGKRVMLPLHVFQLNEPARFPASQRVNGVYFYYPSREIDEVTLTLPAFLDIETLPQPEAVQLDYAMYKSTWTQQQHTVSASAIWRWPHSSSLPPITRS